MQEVHVQILFAWLFWPLATYLIRILEFSSCLTVLSSLSWPSYWMALAPVLMLFKVSNHPGVARILFTDLKTSSSPVIAVYTWSWCRSIDLSEKDAPWAPLVPNEDGISEKKKLLGSVVQKNPHNFTIIWYLTCFHLNNLHAPALTIFSNRFEHLWGTWVFFNPCSKRRAQYPASSQVQGLFLVLDVWSWRRTGSMHRIMPFSGDSSLNRVHDERSHF